MIEKTPQRNPTLVGDNALRSDVNQPWEQDNQAWWDWYVTLADNRDQPIGKLQCTDPLPAIELPSDDDIAEELRTPYHLTPIARERFRTNGYIKLRGVLSPGAILRLRQELVQLLSEAFNAVLDGGTTERFLSLEMVWLDNPLMRAFVLSPRLAKIAANLLDVQRVRLYHDNVLSKEPGCGLQQEYPSYGAVDMGDARVRTTAALAALMQEFFDGAQVAIEPAVVSLRAAPDLLAREAAGFFYASFVLLAPAHTQMLRELEALFTAQGLDGRSRFAMPINRLVVQQPS